MLQDSSLGWATSRYGSRVGHRNSQPEMESQVNVESTSIVEFSSISGLKSGRFDVDIDLFLAGIVCGTRTIDYSCLDWMDLNYL